MKQEDQKEVLETQREEIEVRRKKRKSERKRSQEQLEYDEMLEELPDDVQALLKKVK